jgi:hypothetical protein
MSVTKAVLTDPSHTIAEMATNLGKSRATIMGMASMQMLPLEKWHVDTKKDALAAPLYVKIGITPGLQRTTVSSFWGLP